MLWRLELASLHVTDASEFEICLTELKLILFNLNYYLVEIALPLRKADAGAGLSKIKAKFAMKYNNDYFVLSLVSQMYLLYYLIKIICCISN